MTRLHINIDHVATLRNQRDTPYPDPVEAARLCLAAGAQGITVHLREDRRHIRDADVRALRKQLDTVLNLEMAATEEMCGIAEEVHPQVITLVPERREERTTEGGLDVRAASSAVERVAQLCERTSIKLSLFIEADLDQVRLSRELGARQVEFHTGHYAEAGSAEVEGLLPRFAQAAELAHELGLEVAAGHGLHCGNVAPIVRVPHMAELNIGHAVISEAVLVGLPDAVRRLRRVIDEAL